MKIVGINSSHDTSVCQYDTETQTLDFMYEEDRFRRHKYWSPVARIDNVYGDRNLFCVCPPIEDYEDVSNA